MYPGTTTLTAWSTCFEYRAYRVCEMSPLGSYQLSPSVAQYESVPSANSALVISGMRSAVWNCFQNE
eukprot:562214-Prymnesium_polylepis.1